MDRRGERPIHVRLVKFEAVRRRASTRGTARLDASALPKLRHMAAPRATVPVSERPYS